MECTSNGRATPMIGSNRLNGRTSTSTEAARTALVEISVHLADHSLHLGVEPRLTRVIFLARKVHSDWSLACVRTSQTLVARMKRQFALLSEIANDLTPRSFMRWFKGDRALCDFKAPGLTGSSLELNRIFSWFALETDTAIVLTDAQAIVLWVNPAFTRLTGYELSDVVGERAGRAQQGPDTSPETLKAMREAISRGDGFNVEIVNYRKCGQAYWVDIEARPVRNSSGAVEYYIASQKDITTQRLQTEQLKQSKLSAERLASDLAASRQQLRMAADAGGLSLWDWDLGGDRFWISSRWVPIANEQWIEKCGLWDLFTLAHEADFPRIEKTITELLSPEPPQINEQFRMVIAGNWRWVNFRGAVSARDAAGNPSRISGTLLDETDRKQAEERAQADRDLLQCVIGHIPHAVFWKNAERRYLGCNKKFAESLGLESEHQVIGHLDCELNADPDQAEMIAASDHEIVTSGQQIIAQQLSLQQPDGSRSEILCSKVPLRTHNGTVFGMLGIFNDITSQKRLERQLADARQLESLGRLAAGVAHEINTPMQYISDNVEFLSESTSQVFELIDRVQSQLTTHNPCNLHGPTDNSSVRDSAAPVNGLAIADAKLNFIREQVPRAIRDCLMGSRRVIEIVTAMKVFTYPGTNGFVSSNVNDLITSTTSVTRNRWKYCATVELDLEPDLPHIRCLPSEINQVMLNLMVNAADAVFERYGSSDQVQGVISIRTQRASGGITIEVSDNGCGIPEANASRIFDPFFTTKEVGKGTGQGLTLCYGVVCTKHGGSLTVESKQGEGATFRVFLPDFPCPINEPAELLTAGQDCIC